VVIDKLPLNNKKLTSAEKMRIWRSIPGNKEKANSRRRERYANDLEYRNKEILKRQNPIYKKKVELARRKKPINFWVRNVRDHHKIKGHIFEVSFDEMVKLCHESKNCKICHIPVSWDYVQSGITARTQQSPTLDRTNNEKVLRKDNIQILCLRCNVTKGDRTMKDFIEYCNNVAERFLIKKEVINK